MTDDKSDMPEAERLFEMFRRLGGLLGQAADLVEQAGKLQGKDGKPPVIETRSSMRTLDGEPLDLETLVGALRGANEPAPEDKSRPLRQITPEFVTDTPERLVAVADLPGTMTEDVQVSTEGDLMRIEVRARSADYWAEVMLPRDVSAATRDVSVRNGILNIVWTFPGDAG